MLQIQVGVVLSALNQSDLVLLAVPVLSVVVLLAWRRTRTSYLPRRLEGLRFLVPVVAGVGFPKALACDATR